MTNYRKAKVYLQVANRYVRGQWSISATVVNATNSPPDVVAPGCIVIPVELQIPSSLWPASAPPVSIIVPEDMNPVTGQVITDEETVTDSRWGTSEEEEEQEG